MKNIGTILSVIGASLALLLALPAARAQTSRNAVIPDSRWDCGMPDGIPSPETGDLAFELEIPLERVFDVGKTQYGMRRVAVGLDGSVKGPKLSGAVATGALDFELTLANGVVEIEQAFVLQLADGTYVFARNAGTGPNAQDVRVVMDFEAPNDSAYAWLSSGKFVARRDLDAAGKAMRLRIYDVSKAAASSGRNVSITKPAGIPAQPWAYRAKGADEQQGAMLIVENVTLAPSQRVGDSKRGTRNIIPITGGTVSGRISGKVVRGGADYQLLTPPATIDAHYLWQTDDGEVIVVRNGGGFGALVPTFEARVDGKYAYLNDGVYLSSNPGRGEGGVALTFYESTKTPPRAGP